ncbi:MAG: hypothetical protein AMXMBFR13_34600 [Phycisphaerae bacterium]
MSTKAVAYLRVSGKGQIDGDGFPRQQDAIERYAKPHGIEIVGVYRDEGVSGTTDLEGRAGLAALIDRIESNGVRLVLVERADRLARDLMVGEIILGQLRELGVQVVEVEGGTDLTVADGDPTRTLIRQVLGAVAQFEKSVIVLKLRAARQRIRSRQGRCEGVKPFGATPAEQRAIERIWAIRRTRDRVTGKAPSMQAIANTLNAEGVATRSGRPWQPRTVWAIIQRGTPKAA